jgi:hypothetical protein
MVALAGAAQKLRATCQLHLLHGIKNLYSNNLHHSNHALHARQVYLHQVSGFEGFRLPVRTII